MTRTLVLLCALAVGASADAALSANGSIPLPRARPDGATVQTQAQASPLMMNWGLALREHMRAQADYPALAQLFRSQGVVYLHFAINRQGAVRDARIVYSSGSRLLDDRTMRLLYQAQPFPRPPDELAGDSFDFTIPVRYRFNRPDAAAAQQQSPTGVGTAIGAQQSFDRLVADYRQCITANPNNVNACEELRHLMDDNAQALSGHQHPDH
jgi:TonB family protein